MTEHTPGAMRATAIIKQGNYGHHETAEIIDRETAAPDLLVACKKSLVEFRAMRASDESISARLIDIVETAIDKAEGGGV